MTARIFFGSDIARLLAERSDLRVVLLTTDGATIAEFESRTPPRLEWAGALGSLSARGGLPGLFARLTRKAGRVLYLMLAFRFNHAQDFAGFKNRLVTGKAARRRAQRAGNPAHRWLGFPLPGSRKLFALLWALYRSGWQRDRSVSDLFEGFSLQLLVLCHVQNASINPLVIEARRRGIPIIGMIASWDQPTTKGPIHGGFDRYLVLNRSARAELHRYHGISPNRVNVIGWPQLDRIGKSRPRTLFVEDRGLPADSRLIVFGANSGRIGAHEPAIAAHLAREIAQGRFGRATLWIRCHPHDPESYEAFERLISPPHVIVERAAIETTQDLPELMSHADVLISTGGSIALDAVAVDTPVIGLAFTDDPATPYAERPERLYEMQHNIGVVQSGAVWLVGSKEELDEAVAAYLSNPGIRAEGRQRLRESHLEPLDGRSSARFVRSIDDVLDTPKVPHGGSV